MIQPFLKALKTALGSQVASECGNRMASEMIELSHELEDHLTAISNVHQANCFFRPSSTIGVPLPALLNTFGPLDLTIVWKSFLPYAWNA
jgi:hypothetical protein